ncbi:metalloregulator ArsR/SmtB family transcription factor [Granulicatella adiacens]|uniref:metalloregulator ArsR/SmtB family transcription factor n=1 Tax=Granulicatella adiacens TaxID=46124 RepID=UPI003C757B2B
MAVNEVMSAVSDETRRQILEILRKGKNNTGDLAELIGMTPQALSYHLRKLKQADLIYETRYKNFIYYELNLTVLDEAIVWINQIIGGK